MISNETNNTDFLDIINYYMTEGINSLSKSQFEKEMMDLLTIVDFIEDRVPYHIKVFLVTHLVYQKHNQRLRKRY